jgi:hypothetical protein
MQWGCKTGSTNQQHHNAGGQSEGERRPKKPQLVSPEPDSTLTAFRGFSQVTEMQGSFFKIIILLLCLFSLYFKGRSAQKECILQGA